MTELLTKKYRPAYFADMVGQPLTSTVLDQMVKTNSTPNALLFAGPRGVGKTTAARILAMELNPSERESILANRSLSVLELDAASHGSVSDIRELIEQLRYEVGAENRVVIIDEAHAVTRDGFKALLKTLEEPPEGVVFVLVTTEPHALPDTILSRVMEFEFRRVSPADILSRLLHVCNAEGIKLSRELLIKLAESADGDVREGIKNLDFVNRAGITTAEQFSALTGEHDVAPLLFAALLTNDHSKIFGVLNQIMMQVGDPKVVSDALNRLITDLFVLKSGGEVTATGAALDARAKLAKAVPSEALYAAVQLLWDLKTKVRWTEDQRAALNTALVLVADKVSEHKTPETKTPDTIVDSQVESDQEEVRELSISELQQS